MFYPTLTYKADWAFSSLGLQHCTLLWHGRDELSIPLVSLPNHIKKYTSVMLFQAIRGMVWFLKKYLGFGARVNTVNNVHKVWGMYIMEIFRWLLWHLTSFNERQQEVDNTEMKHIQDKPKPHWKSSELWLTRLSVHRDETHRKQGENKWDAY